MKLFEPFALGGLSLPNRIVMAPMTRNRATRTIPQEMAVIHYRARASAGLIVSEATQVSARGQGYQDTPGIHAAAQVQAWSRVTEAVHAAGGRMFVQLVHVGRLSHSDFHGSPPVAPSAVRPVGFIRTPRGLRPYETPWVPSTAEVALLVEEFARAAANAAEAGFDGVEIHGASGFLVDQFLQSGTNQRTDKYGGSVENRMRFALEIIEAAAGHWDRSRIGFTLSPGGSHKGIRDDNPLETFAFAARALGEMCIGYLHVMEEPINDVSPGRLMRDNFPGPLITSGSYTRDSGEEALRSGLADLVAFGRAFTANPDLVEKFRSNARPALPDPKTFYSGGALGYVDEESTPAQRFREALSRWFVPGAIYTFVGAGGKTTAMKAVAAFLAETGVKARLTTTTRLGIDEFAGWSIIEIQGPADMARALGSEDPALLLVGSAAADTGKYLGVDPKLLESITLRADTILLVEGDGARRRPMKAPETHEPVIPSNTSTVFAVMGAGAFDEPIDEAHCYNHQKALALVGKTGSFFEPREIAALAADPEGGRKGVLSGMGFRILVNQGDLPQKRAHASEALKIAREKYGIRGALVSFQKGEMYDSTDD